MLKYKNTLRNIIVDYENSKRHVTSNYSDLTAVMSDKKYQTFQNQFDTIIQASDTYTKNLDVFINQLLIKEFNNKELKFECERLTNAFNFLITSDGGIIDRTKAIKKELSIFYKA